MATVLSTLYPPLIDTFMPAFPNTQMAEVHFTVSPYNSSYDISYLHITLVDQRTNKNAFATDANVETPSGTALINGVWIIPFSDYLEGNINPYLELNREVNQYTLYIPPAILKQNDVNERTFVVNSYYKLQLRFDKNNDPNLSLNTINSDYLSTKRAYFSEWSSVCLLKAIPEITIHFNNFTPELDDYLKQTNTSITNLPSDFVVPVRVPQYIPGLIPFAGNLTFAGFDDAGLNRSTNTEYYQRDIKTTSNSEYLMSYRIVVTNQKNVVIRDSGIQYPSKAEKTNNFYWLCDMTISNTGNTNAAEQENDDDTRISLQDDYVVTLTFTTNNQYTFSKAFNFKLVEPQVDNFDPHFYFLNKRELPYYGLGYANGNDEEARDAQKVLVTSEDGKIQLRITNGDNINLDAGYLFIKRASALDNFQNWQLLDCYFIESAANFDRTITDNTLSSLTEYKYACQYLTLKGNWSANHVCQEIIYPDFHDILISRGDRQLAIRYNAQISSMTPVVSRIKIDTLGGRYPKFAENAKLHYKQFQLSGLIVAESDYNRQFLNELSYKEEMKMYDAKMNGKYMVRNDTVLESAPTYLDAANVTNHDLYPFENWWWERKFREEAIEWLNDGEPKLYRSMTEGNLIVMIDGISLTPNPQLGRRIWNFSATLYEVGDGNSLDQLDALGIYDIVNVYDENLTKVLDGDSGVSVPYEEHRYIGQVFGITANEAEQTSTKIVNVVKTNDRHGLIPIDNEEIDTGNSERAWTEALTIGEQVQFLFEGLNREFDPSCIKLKDVKIQFESLPQWYDLDALTPEGTNPYSINLSISVFNSETKEWEQKIGRVYRDLNGQIKWEPKEEQKEPLWAKAGVNITDFINNWETACGNSYELINDGNGGINYIGSLAAQTYYYKANADIDGKQYIKKDDIIENLHDQELDITINENTNISSYYYRTKKDQNEIDLNNHYFLQKDLLEENIIYKRLFDSIDVNIYDNDSNAIINKNYYTKLNNNTTYYKINENFYQIKNNHVDEYYKQKEKNGEEEKDTFVRRTNLVLYRKAGGDYIVENNFESNSLETGTENIVNLDDIKDFESLDDLFSYTLTLNVPKDNDEKLDLNGIKLFDNYYNSKIDIIKGTKLNPSNSLLPSENDSLLELNKNEEKIPEDIAINQFIDSQVTEEASVIEKFIEKLKSALPEGDSSTPEGDDSASEDKELKEKIEKLMSMYSTYSEQFWHGVSSYSSPEPRSDSNTVKSIIIQSQNNNNEYWIMENGIEKIKNDNGTITINSVLNSHLYKNIKWTKFVSCKEDNDNNYSIVATIDSEGYDNINVISKNLEKIFKDWNVVKYQYGDSDPEELIDRNDNRLDFWLKDNIKTLINNSGENQITLTVEPIFENKQPIEQKLFFKEGPEENQGQLTFSLKRGEFIQIYNLPNNTKVQLSKSIGEENISKEPIIIDRNNSPIKCDDSNNFIRENNSSFKIKGTITTTSTNTNIRNDIYILQKKYKTGKDYIDVARTENIGENIIFYNVIIDEDYIYRVKRLSNNLRCNSIIYNDKSNMTFSFKNLNASDENLNAIDRSKDYILDTNLLDRKNIDYYEEVEEQIQKQTSNGTWTWENRMVLEPVEKIDKEKIENYYIKYNNIYLKVGDIKKYPYFTYNESSIDNPFKEIDGTKIYYKISNSTYIEIPEPETVYIRIYTKENIEKAEQENSEEIEPYYILLDNWENENIWNKYYYYNYKLDSHMGNNCYNLNPETNPSSEWWAVEEVNRKNLYENTNENSIVPTFILAKNTDVVNKKYYYQVTLIATENRETWNYPEYNYYPLSNYFEKLTNTTITTLADLKKYVYVANISKYLPAANIKEDSQTFGPGNELIKVNLNTGADLGNPGISDATDNITINAEDLSEIVEDKINRIVKKNYGLGYKLRLILTSPYDQTMNLERTIFVNERGYYQVPSNMIVKDIGLFDGAKATIDYIIEYEAKYNDISEPNAYEVAENIVGQVSGEWDYLTQIAPMIAAKYYAYDKEDNGYTITQQSVDYWRATSYDGTPYTILGIKFTGLDHSKDNLIVSRSGVLNLETDYPTEAITILGKRMVQVPKDRQGFLDEWEYVLDDSVFNDSSEDQDSGVIHWWVVHPLSTGEDLEEWEESEVLIKVNLSGQLTVDQNLNINDAKDAWKIISEDWHTITENPEKIKTEVIHPEYNTVYKILNNGTVEYKIYYLNQGWYPVDFPSKDAEGNITDYTICNAKVPVNGMINYRAGILKKLWINE